MDGDEPAGGRWNLDDDNREPPPKGAVRLGVDEPWWPAEDEIDEQVRADLDRWERDGDVAFVGVDGPRRFAATRAEALAALRRLRRRTGCPSSVRTRTPMLAGDDWMAHSLLSAPLNLGLLDPIEVVRAGRAARTATAPSRSRPSRGSSGRSWAGATTSGTSTGTSARTTATPTHLSQRRHLPEWFADLDADAIEARCLSHVLAGVRDHGWVHHIPRLMVLGNYALQRGWRPDEVTDWFHRAFVDGYDWVMVPNVVGMSQHADGGVMATKPYAAGGAYINRMSDSLRRLPVRPEGAGRRRRLPVHRRLLVRSSTATASACRGNHRMAQAAARPRPARATSRRSSTRRRRRGSDPP